MAAPVQYSLVGTSAAAATDEKDSLVDTPAVEEEREKDGGPPHVCGRAGRVVLLCFMLLLCCAVSFGLGVLVTAPHTPPPADNPATLTPSQPDLSSTLSPNSTLDPSLGATASSPTSSDLSPLGSNASTVQATHTPQPLDIPTASACNALHWDSLIDVMIELDISEMQQPSDSSIHPGPASTAGHRRLYRALFKALCGHPIEVGVAGTSVSAGHGVDGDVNRIYAHYVWEWLGMLPLLPQAAQVYRERPTKLRHGYRNCAIGGSGSGLGSICMSAIWSVSTGIRIKVNESEKDPSPDPHGLTSHQLADKHGQDVVIPDLLLVEYMVNDIHFVRLQRKAAATGKKSGLDDLSDPAINMERLLHGFMSHPASAPVLVNTVAVDVNTLDTEEQVYDAAVGRFGIPVISWYNSFNEPRIYGFHARQATGLGQFVHKKLLIDHDHANDAGHLNLAVLIIKELERRVQRIKTTIALYTRKDLPITAGSGGSSAAPGGGVESAVAAEETTDSYCALSFGFAKLQSGPLKTPLSHAGWQWENRATHKNVWSTNQAGSLLVFSLRTFVPRLPLNTTFAAHLLSITYLRSWSLEYGEALAWAQGVVSFELQLSDSSSHVLLPPVTLNISTPKSYDGHWELSQTTTVVNQVPLWTSSESLQSAVELGLVVDPSASRCLSQGALCTIYSRYTDLMLYVSNPAAMNFSFVGLSIEVTR